MSIWGARLRQWGAKQCWGSLWGLLQGQGSIWSEAQKAPLAVAGGGWGVGGVGGGVGGPRQW